MSAASYGCSPCELEADSMIYCVIPEAMADELYEKLVSYYADDDNVEVIIDRRSSARRARGVTDASVQQRTVRDRRRARVAGDFPELELTDD
jgi:hypothetical protein